MAKFWPMTNFISQLPVCHFQMFPHLSLFFSATDQNFVEMFIATILLSNSIMGDVDQVKKYLYCHLFQVVVAQSRVLLSALWMTAGFLLLWLWARFNSHLGMVLVTELDKVIFSGTPISTTNIDHNINQFEVVRGDPELIRQSLVLTNIYNAF